MAKLPIMALRGSLVASAVLMIGQAVPIQGATAAPANRVNASSIKFVALTTRDVTRVYGGGFRAFMDGVMSNQDIAAATKTAGASGAPNPALKGRITGYSGVWFKGSKSSSISVTSALNEYQNSSLPRGAFSQMRSFKPMRGISFHFSPMNGLGDAAASVTIVTRGATAHGVVFSRGRYLAEIMVGARHAAVNVSAIVRLAAIEDQRIQSAG